MNRKFVSLIYLLLLAHAAAPAQSGEAAGGKRNKQSAPPCDTIRALGIVRGVADHARLIEKTSERVAATTRVADLLWTHEQSEARAFYGSLRSSDTGFCETGRCDAATR